MLLNLNSGYGDMKNMVLYIFWPVLVLLANNHHSQAQQLNNQVAENQLALFTDRTMYVTGECIRFSIFQLQPGLQAESALSQIMYVELITPDGKRMADGKFRIDNLKSNGCIEIPAEVISGNYYVRAYTRYMRNFGTEFYPSVAVKLINPSVDTVISYNGLSQADTTTSNDTDYAITEINALSTDRKVYPTRNKVNLQFQPGTKGRFESVNWCLTVIPQGTDQTINASFKSNTTIRSLKTDSPSLQLHPESRGISLSGKLVKKGTGETVPGREVTLSIVGDKDFSAYRTDANGQFYFSLPDYQGNRDLFLSSKEDGDTTFSILIDNDFCTRQILLPTRTFRLTEDERNAGLSLAINMQITKNLIKKSTPHLDSASTINIRSFYGEPTSILVMDKYVQLPTLREYFNELPMEARIRERLGHHYFKFYSTNAEMLAYDPLVMIDWVAIADMDKILAINPQNISSIEIVNKPYVKGDITYGGVISILSRKGDFAGIVLPASGTFLNYDFLSYGAFNSNIPGINSEKLPDTRNVLYWNPDVQLDNTGKADISFYTSDTSGNFKIVAMGIDKEGRILRAVGSFEVKKGQISQE